MMVSTFYLLLNFHLSSTQTWVILLTQHEIPKTWQSYYINKILYEAAEMCYRFSDIAQLINI